MRQRLRRAGILFILLCMVTAFGFADTMHKEVSNPDIGLTAELGYGGTITYGKAMPVRVRIENFGADLEGKIGINAYASALAYNRYEMNISVPSGAEMEYVLPFSVLTRQGIFTLEVLRDDEVVRAVNLIPDTVINPSSMLIGVLSSRPRMLANMDITQENDTLDRYEYWQTVPLTTETFPETETLLNAFGILVIDDIDPASLTERQQQALSAWIKAGHILISGGGQYAAQNVAYFSGLTGLTVERTESSGSVLPALERQAGSDLSGAHPEILTAVISGNEPIVRDNEGRGLIWRTEIGNGRIYTTAFEAGESRLNMVTLMHWFWQQMLVQYDAERYNTLLYAYDRMDAAMGLSNDDTVFMIPVRSLLLPAALTIGAAMILGCVIWMILKKKDRCVWMWLVIPVLALSATGVILALSGSSDLNRPMAVYAESVLQDSTGDTNRSLGINVAVPRTGIHHYSLGGAPIFIGYNESAWIDEDERPSEPTEMQVCYTVGKEEQISGNSTSPWEIQKVMSSGQVDVGGRLEGSAWMEEDGIHGEIRNGTSLSLKEGKVLCGFGYVSVPAIKPGESAQFVLLEGKGTQQAADGVMLRDTTYSMYSMTYFCLGMAEYEYQNGNLNTLRQQMLGSMLERLSGENSLYASDMSCPVFLYWAEPEEGLPFTVRVDGETVENRAGLSMFGAELRYETTGRTGVIYHAAGMDPAVRVEPEDIGTEIRAGASHNYRSNYVNLSENPTFRFALADAREADITALRIVMDTWYTEQMKCYLLNAGTGEWEEINLNRNIPEPARFLDDQGNLYCQFQGTSDDGYQDIPLPMLTLEGRLQHAEN